MTAGRQNQQPSRDSRGLVDRANAVANNIPGRRCTSVEPDQAGEVVEQALLTAVDTVDDLGLTTDQEVSQSVSGQASGAR